MKNSTGIIILGIMWILLSLFLLWAKNTEMGIVWLCAGIIELILGFIRRNKEKKDT